VPAARNLLLRNGVWYARIRVNGRDVWRSLRTADEREARRRLKEVRRQAGRERAGLSPPPVPEAGGRVWEDAVVRWSQTHLPGKRESTAKRYLCSLAQVEAHLRGRLLAAITQACLNDWVAARLEDGVTPATVRRDLTAVSLEWQDVDLNAGTVTFARTKTRSPRVIRLSPRTVAMLRALPRHPRLTYVFWHPGGKNGIDRFRNVASNFRELVTRRLRSGANGAEGAPGFHRCGPAAFRPFRCHDLRHTWGIRALQRGMPIFEVSRHLGYATVRTTGLYVAWPRQAPG
jgi:integrase